MLGRLQGGWVAGSLGGWLGGWLGCWVTVPPCSLLHIKGASESVVLSSASFSSFISLSSSLLLYVRRYPRRRCSHREFEYFASAFARWCFRFSIRAALPRSACTSGLRKDAVIHNLNTEQHKLYNHCFVDIERDHSRSLAQYMKCVGIDLCSRHGKKYR